MQVCLRERVERAGLIVKIGASGLRPSCSNLVAILSTGFGGMPGKGSSLRQCKSIALDHAAFQIPFHSQTRHSSSVSPKHLLASIRYLNIVGSLNEKVPLAMKSGYFRCRPIHKTEECRDSTLHHMFLVPGQERSRVGGSRTLIHPPANGMSTPLLILAQIP